MFSKAAALGIGYHGHCSRQNRERSMRMRVFLIFLACLISSCSSEDSGPSFPPGPSGEVIISSPTNTGTYTTFQDTIDLSGSRSPYISAVTWEDTSTGAAGTGGVWSSTHWCWFFGYFECTDYYWYASVPLQEGENLIKIYGDGTWADSITVTKVPSFGVSGTVAYNGTGQLNIKLTLVDIANASSLFTAYTDTAGLYRFTFIPAGTYTLTPEDPCYTFTPPNLPVTGTNTDIIGQNFAINAKQGATISGRLTYVIDGAGVWGAAITLADTLTSAITGTVSSNPKGYYTFTCIPDGSYAITPSMWPLSFNPGSKSVTVTGGADVPGQDFQAVFVP